jgi:hypothetical protein
MRRRVILAAATVFAAATLGTAAAGAPEHPSLQIAPIILPADLGKAWGPSFPRRLLLTSEDKTFKGWSGLWVSPNGKQLDVVEEGIWAEARLTYDRHGDLGGFAITRTGPLLDGDGKPLSAEDDKEAEALDVAAGCTPAKPSALRSSSSMNTSTTRTGLSSVT